MDKGKQIKIGALISYFTIFFNIAMGLIYTPWMMKTIGQSDYGLYTLAMSLINTFAFDFGLSMAAQRYIAANLAKDDQAAANKTAGLIYKLYLVITVVLLLVFLLLFFFIESVYTELTLEEIEKFRGLYLIAAIYSVCSFPFLPLNGVLSAYEKFVQLKVSDLIHKILNIILTVAALIAGVGVYSLVLVNLVAGIAFAVVRVVLVKRSTPIRADFSYRDKSLVRELFSFSLWTSVFSLTTRLMLSLAPSVLGIVSGSYEIAVFGFAVALESYIYTFINAINGFFMARLSRISEKNAEKRGAEEATDLMISVGRFILMLFTLIFVGFVALGKDFISLLFGEQYINSYYCTLLICGYGFIAYPQQIANTYLVVKGKVKQRAIISAACLAVNLFLSLFLGKRWGAVGVSVAIFIALILNTFLMNILYHCKLGISLSRFFKNCHLNLLPGVLSYAVMAFAISRLPLGGWGGFILKVSLSCVVYGAIAWFLMLDQEKKAFIKKALKMKRQKG